jgi:hypothetical protein
VGEVIDFKKSARKAAQMSERSGGPIVSSVIRSVAYDEAARELDVTFVSGKTYRYFGVELAVYAEFLDAASKGEFFNQHIKNVFAFAEVNYAG